MATHPSSRLVICSKSAWNPAIRREHALASQAARDGFPVTFVERPLDVRALRARPSRRAWLSAALSNGPERDPEPGLQVRPRATFAPGHRSAGAQLIDGMALERSLRGIPGLDEATIVVNLPWHWPAAARVRARARILDYTDDWLALTPGREKAIGRLLAQVEQQADAIIVVSNELREAFPGREAVLVRNGVGEDVLTPTVQPLPGAHRIVYLGTLSDRFDAPFMKLVMSRLPAQWTFEIYGPCQYPHAGTRPSLELLELLRDPRISWLGPIERDRVAGALDRADVLVVPHRRVKPDSDGTHPSWRGDVMKLYDYAARGRAIVSTNFTDLLRESGPPELRLTDDPADFAASITRAATTSESALEAQRSWAGAHTWEQRWQDWKQAAGLD